MSVVVITGCSSGIGLQAALAFARNGDTVVATVRDVCDADELRAATEAGDLRISLKQLDISNSDSFAPRVKDIVAEHGGIDVLVNNAGIHRIGALEDVTEEAFRHVMEVNCTGPLLLTREVLPHMRRQNGGLVIMMSSLSGIAGLPGDLPYAASKFALEGATEALRHEVDRWGIRVALVEAGGTRTNIMAHDLPQDYPQDSPYRPLIEWQLNRLRANIPEAFEPTDVANLFVEIASSDEHRLRWPADPIAAKVLATLHAQGDKARDTYLRGIAAADWWSRGEFKNRSA
jgi:NAD(P)-dependent dehydrogenase (short-subunit alcohol dehydrogenase family)